MTSVQIFGTKKHPDVRKALRFFSERRIETHFVDFKVRAPSPGELKRFVQKFSVDRLLDRSSRTFADLGLHAARYTDDRWIEKLIDEPSLLVLPLVRYQNKLSVGPAEAEWKEWLQQGNG